MPRPDDIDMAMIAGTGHDLSRASAWAHWPSPMRSAWTWCCNGLEELQKQYGERFRPAQLLKTKVRAGHLGVKTHRGFMEYA